MVIDAWSSRPVLYVSDSCFQELRRSDPINQVRRYHPTSINPASKEMISDSVELCETEVCVLHMQLIGTKRLTSEKYTRPLLMWILSPPDLLQNQSLETIQVCTVVLCFPHDNIAGIRLYDECLRSNAPSICHKLLSIV